MAGAVAKLATETGDLTLGALAVEHLDAAGGDTRAAAAALADLIQRDATVRAAVIGAAISEAARYAVGAAMRQDRRAIWHGHAPRAKTRVSALAGGLARSLMDFPLAGGLRLADATREEVAAQADLYAAARDDAARKARWLSAIASALPEGARVRDALSEDQVAALHREATEQ